MATQIASTPIIKNKEVVLAIVKEVNKKPSDNSKYMAKKLEKKFEKMSIKL